MARSPAVYLLDEVAEAESLAKEDSLKHFDASNLVYTLAIMPCLWTM